MSDYLNNISLLTTAVLEEAGQTHNEIRFLNEQGIEYYATLIEVEDDVVYIKLEEIE
jgi:hypothetical protein